MTVEKTITVTVTPVNDPPVAVDQAVTTPEDMPINGIVRLDETKQLSLF